MKAWLCVFLSASALFAAPPPDLKALVKQSIANFHRSREAALKLGYTQTDTTYSGNAKVVEVSEITPLFGTPYERLISKNGQSLPPDERRKEEEKFQKVLEHRQNESAQERAARIRKYESDWTFLQDVPNAYNFKLLGEENLNGRPSWIVGLTPRENFRPVTARGAMLRHIQGRLWIDQQDVQWAKAEAHVIDTISIGWILARIGPGAEIRLDLERVADGVWMPKHIDINGNARVLMVHRKNIEEQLVFNNYRQVGAPERGKTASAVVAKAAKAGNAR